ncbi:DciA family protein [Coxiella burnetii]|uniref:DciA family protein n=1 Tax=Coxiella burnetii TaxID=777 RepID=UPI00057C83F8|nr:DciA family protein [Coxiella burnetii]
MYIIRQKRGIFFNKMNQIPPDDPKRISHCFQSGTLRTIAQKANQIATLEKLLARFLPQELVPHCHVMNITGNTLILQLDSGAVAMRVRYLTPSLLEQLAQQEVQLAAIQCHVRP